MGSDIEVTGTEDWTGRVHAILARARAETSGAVDDALATIERAAQDNLTRYTHGPGERTGSPPGQPPALVSGALRRSVKSRRTADGPTVFGGAVGPTIIYAAIQEFGGTITPKRAPMLAWRTADGWRRARSVTLPPRPYMRPAVTASIPRIRRIVADAWTRALRG